MLVCMCVMCVCVSFFYGSNIGPCPVNTSVGHLPLPLMVNVGKLDNLHVWMMSTRNNTLFLRTFLYP